MNIEILRQHCLAKRGVEESLPFGPNNLVFKVGGKVFLLASLDAVPLRFNIKCNPEEAIMQREQYAGVLPGYHMNKQHWNTIIVDGKIASKLLYQWIDNSYTLVFSALSKKVQQQILKNDSI